MTRSVFRLAGAVLAVALILATAAGCGTRSAAPASQQQQQEQRQATKPTQPQPPSPPQSASPAKLEKVTTGWTASLVYGPVFVAIEKGYFRDEGIELELQHFKGISDSVSALATGKLDADLGAATAGLFNAFQRGLDFKIVVPMGIQPAKITTFPLLVRAELADAVRSGKDLKGRKVAINVPGASVEYKLSEILRKHGLTLKDVQVVILPFPEMVNALKTGAVDAAIPTEPFATRAVKTGVAKIVEGDSDVAGGLMTTMIFFSGKFIREKNDVAVRFVKAAIRGARDLQGEKKTSPEILQILSKYTKLDPETIKSAVFPVWDPDLDIGKYASSLDAQQAVHLQNGRLEYKDPIPSANMIDPSLAQKARAALK